MDGFGAQRAIARRMKSCSRSRIAVDADGRLELEHEARADRFDDRRRAALLAMLDVREVDVLERVHVRDRAAARHARHPVPEQLAPGDEHARRPGAADELVRRDEHRVLVGQRVGSAPGPSRSATYGAGGREVAERQGAVLVEQARDRVRVRHDAGHVRGRREAADLQRPVGVAVELVAPGARGRCGRRASSRIVTRSAIDSRHGSSLLWCSNGPTNTTGRCSARDLRPRGPSGRRGPPGCRMLRTSTRRLIGGGRARAAEHDRMALGSPPTPSRTSRRASSRKRVVWRPGARRLRVRVRVQRQHRVADEVLDERQAPAGRRVVRVGHARGAVRAGDRLVVADDRRADEVHERVGTRPGAIPAVERGRGAARVHWRAV